MILAMLSGGLDSVAMIHLLLKSGQKIHIHHVEIQNQENRATAETIAVNNVLNYFRTHDYPEFKYTTSKIDCPTLNGKFLYDTDTINFFAGFICSADTKIKQVALGMNKTDWNGSLGNRIERANNILKLFANVEKIYPVKEYTKTELLNLLPAELSSLAWSCRTPNYIDGYAKACKQCYTCGQLSKMGIVQADLLLV